MTADDRFNKDFRDPNRDQHHSIRSEDISGPVTDWATDFSHLDPRWTADSFPIMDDLRERCPIAHTERFGGAWVPTRYEDIAAIAYDTDHFSSRSVNVGNFRPPQDLAPIGELPPITSDPPFHHGARKLLMPAFTKTAVARLESPARGPTATPSWTASRDGTSSRRPRSTRSGSPSRSSATCLASRRGAGSCSASSLRTSTARRPSTRGTSTSNS